MKRENHFSFGSLSGRNLALAMFALMDVISRSFLDFLDSLVFPALISLYSQSVIQQPSIGWAAGWAMFGTLIYSVTPEVFPSRVDDIFGHPYFQVVTAGTAVGIGIVVESAFLDSWYTGSLVARIDVRWLPAVAMVGVVLFTVVLWRYGRWSLWSINGPLATLVEGFTPFTEIRGHPDSSRGDPTMVAVGGLGIFILVCVFLGLFALGISNFYPLPELLVLVYVTLNAIDFSGNRWTIGRWIAQIDQRLTIGVSVVTWGLKGMMSLTFALLGILMSVFFFMMSVLLSGALISQINIQQAVAIQYRIWIFVGLFLLTAFLLGGYGLWFWLRIIDRLPYFLNDWSISKPANVEVDWTFDDHMPLLSRPPGMLMPWVGLELTLLIVFDNIGAESNVPSDVYLFGWLVVVAGFIWFLYQSLSVNPQPPFTDGYAIPVAFVSQLIGYGFLADFSAGGTLSNSIAELRIPPTAFLLNILAFVLLVWALMVLYYTHDVISISDESTQSRLFILMTVPMLVSLAIYGALSGETIPLIYGIGGGGIILLLFGYKASFVSK